MGTSARNRPIFPPIRLAIRDYLEKKAMEDIIALSGKIHVDPNWEREEALERDE